MFFDQFAFLSADQLALMIPIIGVSIPIVAIVTSHQRKLAEIKAQRTVNVPANVQSEMEALRNEVAALRDTTTRFDLSFDAAITRLEDRVDRVETRQTGVVGVPSGLPDGATVTLGQGTNR